MERRNNKFRQRAGGPRQMVSEQDATRAGNDDRDGNGDGPDRGAHRPVRRARAPRRIRIESRIKWSSSRWKSTYMKGDPKRDPTAIIARAGNSKAQASPASWATISLLSHCRRAESGRVMCQACVPDALSSPNESIPARPAIAIHTARISEACYSSILIVSLWGERRQQARAERFILRAKRREGPPGWHAVPE